MNEIIIKFIKADTGIKKSQIRFFLDLLNGFRKIEEQSESKSEQKVLNELEDQLSNG